MIKITTRWKKQDVNINSWECWFMFFSFLALVDRQQSLSFLKFSIFSCSSHSDMDTISNTTHSSSSSTILFWDDNFKGIKIYIWVCFKFQLLSPAKTSVQELEKIVERNLRCSWKKNSLNKKIIYGKNFYVEENLKIKQPSHELFLEWTLSYLHVVLQWFSTFSESRHINKFRKKLLRSKIKLYGKI